MELKKKQSFVKIPNISFESSSNSLTKEMKFDLQIEVNHFWKKVIHTLY